MKKNGKLISIISLIVIILVLGALYLNFKEKPVEGSKSITITVVDNALVSTTYELKTDALYLKEAMDECEGLEYSGTDSEYGLMVEVINGISAIYSTDNAYWAFYVNEEYCNYGIEEQPVEDGDAFSIVYSEGF